MAFQDQERETINRVTLLRKMYVILYDMACYDMSIVEAFKKVSNIEGISRYLDR